MPGTYRKRIYMSSVHTDSFRQTPICAHSTQRVNKPFSYYFYNNPIVLLFPLKYLIKYLRRSFASSQISVTRIRVMRPDQELCRHPNMGDAAVNTLIRLCPLTSLCLSLVLAPSRTCFATTRGQGHARLFRETIRSKNQRYIVRPIGTSAFSRYCL